jgi:CBS domain containing-hemolysin-like protein
MEIALAVSLLLLLALTFLATVDMAFSQLSDIGLRRLAAEAEEHPERALHPAAERDSRKPRALQPDTVGGDSNPARCVHGPRYFRFIELVSSSAGSLIVALLGCLLLAGVFRQFIPRFLSLRNPEGKLLRLLPIVQPFYRALAFAAEPWHRQFDRMREEEDEETTDEEEEEDSGDDIEALIDVGEAEGIIEEEERELIQSAIEFGDTRVGEVMTPRTEIVGLPNSATVRQARDMMIESRHSRLAGLSRSDRQH